MAHNSAVADFFDDAGEFFEDAWEGLTDDFEDVVNMFTDPDNFLQGEKAWEDLDAHQQRMHFLTGAMSDVAPEGEHFIGGISDAKFSGTQFSEDLTTFLSGLQGGYHDAGMFSSSTGDVRSGDFDEMMANMSDEDRAKIMFLYQNELKLFGDSERDTWDTDGDTVLSLDEFNKAFESSDAYKYDVVDETGRAIENRFSVTGATGTGAAEIEGDITALLQGGGELGYAGSSYINIRSKEDLKATIDRIFTGIDVGGGGAADFEGVDIRNLPDFGKLFEGTDFAEYGTLLDEGMAPLRAQIEHLVQQYGPNHPKVQAANANLSIQANQVKQDIFYKMDERLSGLSSGYQDLASIIEGMVG